MLVRDHFYDDLYAQKIASLTETEQKEYKKKIAVRLSAYHIEQPYASLFFPYEKRYADLLEEKFGITPIYKPGLQFILFNDGIKQDSVKTNLTEKYKQKVKQIRRQRKKLRDSLRANKQSDIIWSSLKNKQDSLRRLLKETNLKKEESIRQFEENKHRKILRALKSLVNVKLNDLDINDSLTCYFTRHHNNNEPGIICNFPVGHLPPGNHLLQIEKTTSYRVENDSIYTREYILPFVKQF